MALNNLGLGFLFTAKDMASGAVQGINSNIENLSRNSEKAQRAVQSATQSMAKGAKLMGAGTAILGAVTAPVLISSKWEKGMAEVWTVTDVTRDKLTSMGDEALGVMAKYGEELGNTTGALYDILSASIPVEDSIGFLDQAMKSSVAGVTDAKTAVNALTNVLNGYTNQSYTATQASDMIFTAVKNGKTTFGEMAHSIGEVNSMADGLGLGFEHIAGSFATLTKGNNTAKSATMIKAVLTAAMSKQERAAKMGSKVRKAFSLENLKTKGLQKWMVEVNDAVGGSQEKLVKLLGSSEAVSMFMAMTGKGAKVAAGDLLAMKNSAGATDAALQKMSQIFDFLSKKASAGVKSLMVHVGTGLREAVTPLIGIVGNFVGALAEWAKNNKPLVTTIMKVVAGIGLFLVGAGAILCLKGAIMILIAVVPTMVTALGAMILPFLIIAAKVALVVGVLYLLKKAWDSNLGGIQGIVSSFVDGVVQVFMFLKNAVINIAMGIYDGFKEWVGPIVEPLKEAFGVLFVTISDLFSRIGGLFGGMGTESEKGGNKFMIFLKAMGNVIGNVLGFLVTVVANVLAYYIKFQAFMINVFIAVGEGIGTAIGWIVVNVGKFVGWIGKAWDWIVESVGKVADTIGSAFVSAWEFVKKAFRTGVAFIMKLIFTPWRAILKLAEKIPMLGGYAKSLREGIDSAIATVGGDEVTVKSKSDKTAGTPMSVAPAAVAEAQGQSVMMSTVVEKSDGNTESLDRAADALMKVSKRPIQTTVVLDGEKVNKTMTDRRNMDQERSFSPGE